MDFAKSSFCLCLLIFLSKGINGEDNRTSEALWNLTGYALLQSRQRLPGYPIQPIVSSKHPDRFQAKHHDAFHPYFYNTPQIQNYDQIPPSTFGIYQSHSSQSQAGYDPQRPQLGLIRPYLRYPQQNKGHLSSFLPSREFFMKALDSIARNDELGCVSRILCEVTSGTLSARQSGLNLPPFNINMDSIVGLLSGFDGMGMNPLVFFGKAALLGYSSKGNAETCTYAYPECPRDPEKLVEYLNTYNGGFFRFFDGIDPQYQHEQFNGQTLPFILRRPPYPMNFHSGVYNIHNKAEKRILTRPIEFDYASNSFTDFRQQKEIKFPNDEFNNELYPSDNFQNAGSSRTLRFPIGDEESRDGPLRQPKRLTGFQNGKETNYQRPTPDHRPMPMIFPDRTGTGELKFSPEELTENYRGPSAFQNDHFISFDTAKNNDPSYFSTFEADSFRRDYPGMNELNNHFFPA